jgi:hypothetical protein
MVCVRCFARLVHERVTGGSLIRIYGCSRVVFRDVRNPSCFASDSRFAKVRMQRAACAKLHRTSDWYKKYRDSAKKLDIFQAQAPSHRDGTIDAQSLIRAWQEEKESRDNRGFGSNVYFRCDSIRRGRRAGRIDLESAAGRPHGNVRTPVSAYDHLRFDEREQSGIVPDRNSVAACKPRSGVDASGFTAASTRG